MSLSNLSGKRHPIFAPPTATCLLEGSCFNIVLTFFAVFPVQLLSVRHGKPSIDAHGSILMLLFQVLECRCALQINTEDQCATFSMCFCLPIDVLRSPFDASFETLWHLERNAIVADFVVVLPDKIENNTRVSLVTQSSSRVP